MPKSRVRCQAIAGGGGSFPPWQAHPHELFSYAGVHGDSIWYVQLDCAPARVRRRCRVSSCGGAWTAPARTPLGTLQATKSSGVCPDEVPQARKHEGQPSCNEGETAGPVGGRKGATPHGLAWRHLQGWRSSICEINGKAKACDKQ